MLESSTGIRNRSENDTEQITAAALAAVTKNANGYCV